MELKCQRCGHEWDYTGESEYFATCPNCKTSVSVSDYHGVDATLGVLDGGEVNGHGSFATEQDELETEANYQLETYEGDDVWVTLSIRVTDQLGGPYIDTVFLDREEGIEFAEGLLEAMQEIDISNSDGEM